MSEKCIFTVFLKRIISVSLKVEVVEEVEGLERIMVICHFCASLSCINWDNLKQHLNDPDCTLQESFSVIWVYLFFPCAARPCPRKAPFLYFTLSPFRNGYSHGFLHLFNVLERRLRCVNQTHRLCDFPRVWPDSLSKLVDVIDISPWRFCFLLMFNVEIVSQNMSLIYSKLCFTTAYCRHQVWRKRNIEHKQFREAQLLASKSARYVCAASLLCCVWDVCRRQLGSPHSSLLLEELLGRLCGTLHPQHRGRQLTLAGLTATTWGLRGACRQCEQMRKRQLACKY